MARYNCEVCGEPSLKPLCFRHAKRTPIPRESKGRLGSSKHVKEGNDIWEFFLSIWNTRPHVCFETGLPLGDEPKAIFFHHLLWKSVYPQYKYDDWNIVLLHPDVHALCHSSLDSCPKVKELTENLKLNK